MKTTASILAIIAAAVLSSCGRAPKYEVDFKYDRLHKLESGQVEVGEHHTVSHIAADDGKGGVVERTLSPNAKPDQMGYGADGFALGLDTVMATSAVFRVTFPDGTKSYFALSPKEQKEQFDSRGNGIRLVLDVIRVRTK